MTDSNKIPRHPDDDFCEEIVSARQTFIEEKTSAKLNHTKAYSYDPHVMAETSKIYGVLLRFPWASRALC